jgi:hypothetical protein
MDRAFIDQDAMFCQPLADLRAAQSVADVPANGQDDDVIGERGPEHAEVERGRCYVLQQATHGLQMQTRVIWPQTWRAFLARHPFPSA